jgi:nucleoside phosphorylase
MTPTPNEHKAVSARVGFESYRNLACRVVECGPGRIFASWAAARELSAPGPGGGKRDVFLVGCGTSGSLSLDLKRGDVVVSNSAVISDWRMEEGDKVLVAPYGWFDYREPAAGHVGKMVLECPDPTVTALTEKLSADENFLTGRLLTSEAFVSGRDLKLKYGETYGCLACDMESGVFGFAGGRLAGVPWFNVRVVADTLDEKLSDYFAMERDVTEVLAERLLTVLRELDELL